MNGETCVFFDEKDIERCWTQDSGWEIELDQAALEFSAVAAAIDCYAEAWIIVFDNIFIPLSK